MLASFQSLIRFVTAYKNVCKSAGVSVTLAPMFFVFSAIVLKS
jgi:hypothetical protein